MEVLSLEGNLSLLEWVLWEGIVTKPELISMPLLSSGFIYTTAAIFSHKDSQPLPWAMMSPSQTGPSVSSVPLNIQNWELNKTLFFTGIHCSDRKVTNTHAPWEWVTENFKCWIASPTFCWSQQAWVIVRGAWRGARKTAQTYVGA